MTILLMRLRVTAVHGEVPDMTGEGGCNLSVTQHNEALSRLTRQNTSKVMGLDSRRRREEDLTN